MSRIGAGDEGGELFKERFAFAPARFRLETENGERVTVRIRQIRRREEIRLMGVESIRFDCLALLGGRLRRFELRYGVRAHRWTLWRFLDRDIPAGQSAAPLIRTCDKP